FLVARAVPDAIPCGYFTKVRIGGGWLVELAGDGDPAALAKALLPRGARIEMVDGGRGGLRVAVFAEGRPSAALYVVRNGRLPDREWPIAQLTARDAASPVELLAGHSAAPQRDGGPVVCVCFDIGMNTIVEAIVGQGLVSVDAIGEALSAGTNCGSCRPAIQRLINKTQAKSGEAATG